MNKMHSLAKIVLTGIALYIAFYLFQALLFGFSMFFIQGYNTGTPATIIISLLFIGLFLGVVIYLFVKLDKIAEKIVGKDELREPETQIQWLPLAFRLTAITAGFYCLFIIITRVAVLIRTYSLSRRFGSYGYIEHIISILILLAIAIYLLCGAPHFVRWHVKKAIEQHKQNTEDDGKKLRV